MDDLKRLALFAEVLRCGSFSAAARHLGVTTSAVSQQVRQLEEQHGLTLLHRSTRRLAPTEAGRQLAVDCSAMLEAAERARARLQAARTAPQGQLRISSPVGLAAHLGPALAATMAAYPALSLELVVDDGLTDLIAHRIDLALRGGRLPDSSWSARRIATLDQVLCASPAYLESAGVPDSPQALAAHQWLLAPHQQAEHALTLSASPRVASATSATTSITSAGSADVADATDAADAADATEVVDAAARRFVVRPAARAICNNSQALRGPPRVTILVAPIGTDNSGAKVKDRSGAIRTSIQGSGGGEVAATGEHIGRRGVAGSRRVGADAGALAQ